MHRLQKLASGAAILWFASLALSSGMALGDPTNDSPSYIDEPNSVQVPLFQDGQFKGYTEMPMNPDRRPNSDLVGQGDSLQLDKPLEQNENPER